MRARVLIAGLVVISTVVMAGSASAKADIIEATITGPGLNGELRIRGAATAGLWDSGIDDVGGLDDTRASSVEEWGLTAADLGPRYRVMYRFWGRGEGLIRQDLYPYAKGGPVTYAPPGQKMTVGIEMVITPGWYRASHPCELCGTTPFPPEKAALQFFRYLVDLGLPETNPAPAVATPERAPDVAAEIEPAPWPTLVGLVGVAALSLILRGSVSRSRRGARP